MQESKSYSETPAKRLLAKLKSPFLCLASDLHKPIKPHSPVSPQPGCNEMRIESLAGGRLAPFADSATESDEEQTSHHHSGKRS